MKLKPFILSLLFLSALSLVSCRKEKIILSSTDLWFPIEGDTATLTIEANCDWTVSINGDADWITVSPMTSKEAFDGTLSVITMPCTTTDQRTGYFTIDSKRGQVDPMVTVNQKRESITLSKYELWFPKEAATKTIEVTSNCKWTLSIDDEADWYSVNYDVLTPNVIEIAVEPYDGDEYRSSSFTLTSEHGFSTVKVYLSQNKLEFDEIINMVFGISKVEHWNTDYFGQIIEDSYKHKEFNPFDTTTGYMMFFLEDGVGVQRDHHDDSVVYYAFTYDYDAVSRNLHIEFETVYDTVIEDYDASVLTASEELFRFFHEYKPNWWERADMRKIGTVDPGEKSLLMRAVKKRKEAKGVFQF